jgi:hypothetical protein
VVEHLPTDPEINGLIPAAYRHKEKMMKKLQTGQNLG